MDFVHGPELKLLETTTFQKLEPTQFPERSLF
jgi:hypothetical protein